MSELPHEPAPSEGEAVILPFNPREPETESEIDQMSDTDCVAFLLSFARHPGTTSDKIYPSLYQLIFNDDNQAWRDRMNRILSDSYFDIQDENENDPVIADLTGRMISSSTRSKDNPDVKEARKVIMALMDLRSVELRDEADGSNWQAVLAKLPDL